MGCYALKWFFFLQRNRKPRNCWPAKSNRFKWATDVLSDIACIPEGTADWCVRLACCTGGLCFASQLVCAIIFFFNSLSFVFVTETQSRHLVCPAHGGMPSAWQWGGSCTSHCQGLCYVSVVEEQRAHSWAAPQTHTHTTKQWGHDSDQNSTSWL